MRSLVVHIDGVVERLLMVWTATSMRERMRGLLGHAPLSECESMLLRPCRLVHTFGMAYAIDIVFLDRNGTVRRIDESVPRSRIRGCVSAWQTLEMAAGAARTSGLRAGMHLPLLRKGATS
jgi:uncharacterized protein